MAEFKLFGTQPNQAPLNADLGTAAFKDAGDFLNSRNGKLAEIEQYLYSSATDQSSQDIKKAFIYDTSLDTDGGAWRKRTKHTSWYNEDLNTSYRGSRREFPSVAIIIVEQNRTVIYDGDDPEFPMWMVLPEHSNTPDYSMFVNVLSNCYALNGKIGFAATFYRYFDFVEDMGYLYDGNTKYTFNYRPIADRNFYADNGRTPIIAYSTGPNISSTHRDVVYKVYPGAKVDSATNLPMPTALIIGHGGFTLLKDHGSVPEDEIKVAEYIQTNTSAVQLYMGDLAPDKHFPVVYAGWHTSSGGSGQVRRYINPAGTYSNTYMWSNTANVDFTMDYNSINDRALQNGEYRYNIAPHPFANQGAFGMREAWSPTSVTALPDDAVVVGSDSNGIVLLHKPLEPRQEWNWMSAYINTKYNTGWMPGSCNLATLADTNTGAWYGGNLLQNANFADTSIWGIYNSSWSVSNNIATITPNNTLAGIQQQVYNLTPGRQYYMQATITAQGARSIRVQISGIGLRDQGYSNQAGTKVVQASFTASNTTHIIEILAYAAVVGETFEVSNVIFSECVADRTHNMNGVQVVGGNVERQKVGTGSDLVSYGPFSSSSYLQQSYNPDLDWNSSADFYVLFWWNPTVDNAYDTLMERGYYSGGYSGARWMIQSGSQNTTSFKINGLTTISTNSGGFSNWQCICYTRRNGVITAYKNGVEQGRAVDTTDFTNTSAYLNIGMGLDTSTAPGDNSQLALLRLGNSYIDEAMAKKIYDDEQKLFARNAKAVLYQGPDVGDREYGNSSDAHNFIYDSDYDPYTGLYHVVNQSGRSTFNNLARVDHSEAQDTVNLDARNSTVAARDGLIVEE